MVAIATEIETEQQVKSYGAMTWDALFIGKVIYATISGISGISTRVYPMRIPQNIDFKTYSAISYYQISNLPEDTKDSRSLIDTVRVQVSIFSDTLQKAITISQAVRDALDGLTGEIAGCSVDYMRFADEVDLYEDEHKIYHRAQEYTVRIKNVGSTNTTEMTVKEEGLTGDYTWSALVPAGYLLEYFIFDETAGHQAQLSAGITAGGHQVFQSEAINPGGLTVVNVNKTFSKTSDTTVYINHAGDGDQWNGASVNIWVAIRKYV